MKYLVLLLIVLFTFTIGCASTVMEGRKIDVSKVDTLALDQPKDKVVADFGPPQKTETFPSGMSIYGYHYYFKNPHWWTTNETERQDLAIVLKNDRVESFNFKGTSMDPVLVSPPMTR
jgi:hypothetical protein